MRGDLLGVFERTTVLQVSGDAGGAKCMTTGGIGQGGSSRAPFDHRQDILLRHRIPCKFVSFPDRAEEGPLLVARDFCGFHPSVQILGEIVVAGHLVALAAFSCSRSHARLPCSK